MIATIGSNVTLAVSFLALGIAFLALIFSVRAGLAANRRRDRIFADCREQVLKYLGDPTAYAVVEDGKFYRVRGPFDTFFTIRFRDKAEAEKYAVQLAHYNGHVFNEQKWRTAA